MIRRLLIFAGLAIALTFPLAAIGYTLEQIKNLPESVEVEQVKNLCRQWLSENPDHAQYNEAISYYLTLITDLDEALAYLEAQAQVNPPARSFLYETAGKMAELAGRLDKAEAFYAKAIDSDGRPVTPALLDAAIVAFKMGKNPVAEERAKSILRVQPDGDLADQAILLLSQIFFASQESEKSWATFSIYVSRVKNPPPDSLLWGFSLSRMLGQTAHADIYFERLKNNYPQSPEYGLASGKWSFTSDPLYTFGILKNVGPAEQENPPLYQFPGESEPNPSTTGPKAPSIRQGLGEIQVGSFLRIDNARAMEAKLREMGYQSSINTIALGGRTYYRVIIPDIEPSQFNKYLIDLAANGFDAFLRY